MDETAKFIYQVWQHATEANGPSTLKGWGEISAGERRRWLTFAGLLKDTFMRDLARRDDTFSSRTAELLEKRHAK